MKKILLVLATVLLFAGCDNLTAPVVTDVTFVSAIQTGGIDGVADSMSLTLTFNVDPTTLTEDDITVLGATKGVLSGTGFKRSLTISNISVANDETVSVVISDPSGFKISGSSQTAVVYRAPIAVNFLSAVQKGGISGTAYTTSLTLTFSVDPTSLAASDITVTGATKGTLTGTGTTRMLTISAITVGNGETVSVAIANPSAFTISGSPQTAVVYQASMGTPYVGMAYQGGKVAYILQSGDPGYVSGQTHGFIASISDLGGSGIQWSKYDDNITSARGIALGTGQANTTRIVNNEGSGSYAAQLCNDYTNTDTGTGIYSDWYMPSLDELNMLYLNRTFIGGFAANGDYWSSSEGTGQGAYGQSFYGNGGNYYLTKGSKLRVRAVRSF